MKKIYSLYAAAFALVVAGAIVLLTPPITVYACGSCAMASTETPSAFRLGPRVVAALTTLAARGPARTGRPTNRIVRRAVTKSC
jgi:hypothetical protein